MQCVLCHRAMGRGTRPRHVFGPDFSYRGQAHTGCVGLWGGRATGLESVGVDAGYTVPEAQFVVWVLAQPPPVRASAEEGAWDLAVCEHPSLEPDRLSPRQAECLAWWAAHHGWDAAQVAAIQAAYAALVRAFHAAPLPAPAPARRGGGAAPGPTYGVC